MSEELLKTMMRIPIDGSVIDARRIPEPIKSEYLSQLDFSRATFPEGPGPLCLNAKALAQWCGYRLRPDYQPPEGQRTFTDAMIEALTIQTYPEDELREDIVAVFKPQCWLVNLMRHGERVGRVAFGYPEKTCFEYRHSYWIVTSAVIGAYACDGQQVLYTKSGSDYRLQQPFQEIERPLGILPLLRRGYSPEDVETLQALERQGFKFTGGDLF